MNNLKLTIDLLPKGAWGNDLSSTLPKNDWDTLRNFAYEKANNTCVVCGNNDWQLEAHEVWDFDMQNKVQTLKDIVALCPACHGVKHMRNSQRIGYGEHAKTHFLKVNNCNSMTFINHYAEAVFLFEERNKVLRWKLKADLSKFGGEGIEIKERNIPIIKNPYEGVDWTNGGCFNVLYNENRTNPNIPTPKIRKINVDNYEGTITVEADYANKIQWIADDKIIKTKYNNIGKFITKFSVEDQSNSHIQFRLIGDGGETDSQKFGLIEVS